MIIGIAKENREKFEKRVILLPFLIKHLIKERHIVRVERDAGKKLKIPDREYKNAGALICPREEVYSSEIVLRIRIPTPEELKLMRPGSLLICMVHRNTHPEIVEEFKKRKINILELNEIKDENGKRLIEAFEISGTEGTRAGFKLFKKLYKKDPEYVVIMGYGNLAIPTIRAAARAGTVVKVLGRKQTIRRNITKNLKGAEIIINTTYRKPEEFGKYLITKKDLLLMNKNSLVLDFSADPMSCIETCHPTNLDNPYYFVKIGNRKIPHMCLYSLPALAPLQCSRIYGEQLLPFLRLIANLGIQKAIQESSSIKRALICP